MSLWMFERPVCVPLNIAASKRSHVGLQLSVAAERYPQDSVWLSPEKEMEMAELGTEP